MRTPFADLPPLHGALVRLRAREQADLTRLNAMFNDPEVLAGLEMTFPQPLAGIRDWMERTRDSSSQATFVIETLQGSEAIGVTSLERIDSRARGASFGIWIGRPFWGRGLGTDATRTVCRFGFRHMNLQRISLCVYAETNAKAVRAYEKTGFKREGIRRQGQFLDGHYVDVLDMGLLAAELIDDQQLVRFPTAGSGDSRASSEPVG
ncbi:MAG: GNAT family N-acetyltransferase [Actinomycetota bacterium]|nr:GNAT family N-acetyltransferase [Actinomycetota bacterium]